MLGFTDWVKQHLAIPQHAPVVSLSLLKRRKRRAAAEVLLSTPELDDLLDRGESRVTFQRHLEIHVVPNRDELSHYHKARLWWTRDDYLAFREAYYDYLLSQERSENSGSDASVSCDEASFCLHIRLVALAAFRIYMHMRPCIISVDLLVHMCSHVWAFLLNRTCYLLVSHHPEGTVSRSMLQNKKLACTSAKLRTACRSTL
jgi:hypothetical protein